jgi:cardiolipin synthase
VTRKRLRRRLRPILRPREGHELPSELREENVGSLAAALPRGVRDVDFRTLLRRIDQGPFLEGNRVELFFRGDGAFEAMLGAIRSAAREILVESYIWRGDRTGRAFLEELAQAVRRGVAVRILADALGSFSTPSGFWREMRAAGIEVRLFHPLFPQLFFQPFRDHRKILVVDRTTAFTGGMNIADEYGSGISRHGGPWRDTHVRVEGDAAWDLAVVFAEAWTRAGGSDLNLTVLEPAPPGGVPILVLDSRPGRGHREMAAVLAAVLGAARERVWITNAYFAPNPLAIELLGAAVGRGVDVRLLLPGRSDAALVRHAGHGYYAQLLERGVRLFEYQAAILHAKTLVADDFVSLVGSTNLDFRSFHLNAECNLLILDGATGRRLSNAFEADVAFSHTITPEAWGFRTRLHVLGDILARRLAPAL